MEVNCACAITFWERFLFDETNFSLRNGLLGTSLAIPKRSPVQLERCKRGMDRNGMGTGMPRIETAPRTRMEWNSNDKMGNFRLDPPVAIEI